MIKQLLAILLSVSAMGGHSTEQERSLDGSARDQVVAALSFSRSFSVMRGPEADLPQELQRHLSQLLYDRRQIAPTSVHHGIAGDEHVWVFVDRGLVCLAQAGQGAVACSPPAEALVNGVTLGVFTPPSSERPYPHDFTVLGLVPDTIRRVAFTTNHHRRTVAVRHNLFSVSAARAILIRRLIKPSA
jgi:hypothetical protein